MEVFFGMITSNFDIVAIGASLTFLTICFTFYKQVAIPVYNATLKPFINMIESIYTSPSRIGRLDQKLDSIIAELKPNSGSSIKDQLNRLEVSVAMNKAQHYLLLNSLPSGVWTSDNNGYWQWVNDPLKTTLSATLENFKGNNWETMIHPEDNTKVFEEWERAVEQKRDFNMHFRMKNLNTNASVNVHAIAHPVLSSDNRIVGWNGTIHFI